MADRKQSKKDDVHFMKRLHYTKILSAVFCICIMLVLSTGCRPEYRANRLICITQACYAIPGGYVSDKYASGADLIEKDEYGRLLMYVGIATEYSIDALCIVQKVDEAHVYYYDNVNYVCIEERNEYEPNQVDALKEANDWGQPLDETKRSNEN